MGRKKHQRTMTLGGIAFESQAAVRRWHQDRKQAAIVKGDLIRACDPPLFGFLLDTFSRHPDADEIVGPGVVAFEYASHDGAWSEYGIKVYRDDGTVYRFPKLAKGWIADWLVDRGLDDFSAGFRSSKAAHTQAVSMALRKEITADIEEFRAARSGSACDACETNIIGRAEIDHDGLPFHQIRNQFYALTGKSPEAIELEDDPLQDGRRLKDRELADTWVVWHLESCTLRYLHPECHAAATSRAASNG